MSYDLTFPHFLHSHAVWKMEQCPTSLAFDVERLFWKHPASAEFSEAHRWLKPYSTINHDVESFLRNLENRKANTLSASDQRLILPGKPAPCPCLPRHALSHKSFRQFICSSHTTAHALPSFTLPDVLNLPSNVSKPLEHLFTDSYWRKAGLRLCQV